MKLRIISLLAMIFLLSYCQFKNSDNGINKQISDSAIVSNSSPRNNIVFISPTRIKPMTTEISVYDTVSGMFENYHYTLYPNGVLRMQIGEKAETIKIQTDEIISEAYLCFYKNCLLIFYADTDMDASASFIECFDKNFHLKWRQYMGGFNLTNPAIVDSISFVASIGFIGKLNLNNGQYIWKYDNLYDTTKFDSFNSIGYDGENVTFNGMLGGSHKGKIVVNDKTGQIIEIKK
jgi:hypothetical protein